MPSIIGLVTNSAFTAVEDKIPVSNSVKKTDYDTKITEIEKALTDHDHDKYIAALEFNNLAARVFIARLAESNVTTKTDFDDKLKSINQKINSKQKIYLVKMN